MPLRRGFKWDAANSRLSLYSDGTEVARFDDSNGLTVLVDGFNLNGQTLTTVNASGSTDMTTWLAALGAAADGSDDEDPKYAIAISVGGTVAYVPCFATI